MSLLRGNARPLVSIVTPCLNSQPYLGDAIASVLGQSGIDIEYLVMDGGSTDGSRELIEAHSTSLAFWRSEPDGGQTVALNRAFARCTGDVLCWLNGDDFFLPQALVRAAAPIASGAADLVSGSCLLFDTDGKWATIRKPPAVLDPTALALRDPLDQPSTIWSRRLWESTGPLDESLDYVMDWDWFNRAIRAGARYRPVDGILSAYRVHPGHKSASGGSRRRDEIRAVVSRYAEPPWPAVFDAFSEHVVRGVSRVERHCDRRGLWRLRSIAAGAYLVAFWSDSVRLYGLWRMRVAARTLL